MYVCMDVMYVCMQMYVDVAFQYDNLDLPTLCGHDTLLGSISQLGRMDGWMDKN